MALSETELSFITGGVGNFVPNANGSYVNYGTYIIYTVAGGDNLRGIAGRFGVSEDHLCHWNNIRPHTHDVLFVGQKLTIYPAILR